MDTSFMDFSYFLIMFMVALVAGFIIVDFRFAAGQRIGDQ